MTKTIDLMETKDDKGSMAGAWMYIFYGDAKKAGIRRGDHFQVTAQGDPVSEWIAEEYITFRNDINRCFKGFRCVRAAA